MYTRCPQCKTAHPVSAAVLAHCRGLVRCGKCNRTFSALSFLFDDWPSGQAHGPVNGPDAGPPVVGAATKASDPAETDAPQNEPPDESAGQKYRLAWGLATALLVLITIANTTWTFRRQLLEYPLISDWVTRSGWTQTKQQGPLKDPQQIQLVSRDLHSHPTRSGILVLNLTFVNLAQFSQAFPELELTLLDAASQPVARRRFQAAEYLRPGADIEAGLAADVFLPILLELGDPGEQAVGFEINFL